MSLDNDFVFGAGDGSNLVFGVDHGSFGTLESGRSEQMAEMNDSTSLSEEQEIILSLLQMLSAILSLIGSCTIVFKILRSLYHTHTTTPYDRIMLGLSSCDVVASFMFAVTPFLLPGETSQRIWAMGNESSCQLLGLLTQLAYLWSIWYNCILSFYYLLTVRFKVKREDFFRRYEIWMHLSGMIFFPITAFTGYFAKWYGEQALVMQCWIRYVPTDCDNSGNCLGNMTEIVGYIYGAIPMVITLLAIIINNAIIYSFVRKSLLASPSCPSQDGDIENISVSENLERIRKRLTKETAIQGFLYVSTFLLTASPTFILVVLDGSFGYDLDEKAQIYPLLVLYAMVAPLQGFFNVFIYVKPSFNRFRIAHPDAPMWFVVKQALFESKIPRMSVAGMSVDPKVLSAIDIKHSQMKSKCGSNFSMNLDNILENGVEEEDGSSELELAMIPTSASTPASETSKTT